MQIVKFKEKSLLFSFFLTLVIVAPFLKLQMITGTIVNAALFLTVLYLGLKAALIIALVPSLAALFCGLLPFFMLPFLPLIMLGNSLLVLVFYFLKDKPYLLKTTLASAAKFCLFFGSVFVLSFYLPERLYVQAASIFGFIQLATALFGAALAYMVFRIKPVFF